MPSSILTYFANVLSGYDVLAVAESWAVRECGSERQHGFYGVTDYAEHHNQAEILIASASISLDKHQPEHNSLL